MIQPVFTRDQLYVNDHDSRNKLPYLSIALYFLSHSSSDQLTLDHRNMRASPYSCLSLERFRAQDLNVYAGRFKIFLQTQSTDVQEPFHKVSRLSHSCNGLQAYKVIE